MQTLSRVLGILLLAVLIGQPIGAASAFAQAMGTLSGTVVDDTAAPLSGATVTLSGPSTVSTKTDSNGHFTLSAPEGLYRILVRAGGFSESTDSVVLGDAGVTLNVQLARPSLSSIQTIGITRGSGGGGGPQFNATPASQSIVSAQVFENQGDTTVRDIIDETPGIVASSSNNSQNGGVPGSVVVANIRGGLSYETASLIDGHPLSDGKYGDYILSYLNRYMFQTIEVQKGPGSMPTTISHSVNGTVNFKTWDPTPTLTGNAEFGVDSYGGKYGNLRVSDTVLNGKLGFVLDYASTGTPGPLGMNDPRSFVAAVSGVSYTNSQGIPVAVSPVSSGSANYSPGEANTTYTHLTTNTIACCISMPTFYLNRSELAKLRFNFSGVTSFTATVLASQTTNSLNSTQNNLYDVVFNPTVPNAAVPSGIQQAFSVFADNFAQDYTSNSEPLFSGELHTQLKNDNVLFRFYTASIGRLLTNGDQSNSNFSLPVDLYGTTTTGQPLTGTDQYGQPYTALVTSPLYQSLEQDNLIGYTFEYDHPLGNTGNVISFTADENYANTHVYTPGQSDLSSTSNIPAGSEQNTATYSLKGDFQVTPKLNVTAAYYLTRFDTHYPLFGAEVGALFPFTFQDNIMWHNDMRFAAAYRLDHDTSLRFAAGSSLVPPYLGILSGSLGATSLCTGTSSGCPGGTPAGTAAFNSIGGLNVQPETSFGYDLGGDYRFKHWADTVLSGDAYFTNLHNQFLKSIYLNGTIATPVTPQAPTGVVPLFTTAYSNLADARYEGIELKLDHAPRVGWGSVLQGALLRGYPYNVPASIYQFNAAGAPTSNQGVVAGANFGPYTVLSSGGSAIPYAQGYGELSYRAQRGVYANLGMIYFGPNNTFNDGAFEIFRSTLRVPVVNPNTYVQLAVDNLFNTNPFIFDISGQGVGGVAVDGQYIATNLKGYGPRNIHLVLVHNFK